MKVLKITALFFFLPNVINAAPRLLLPAKKACTTSCKMQKAMLYKDAQGEKISEKDRDSLMFTHFVGIIINFVKLFLDPKNIPEAKQNAVNILNGINNLAYVITRSAMTPALKDKLVDKIREICQKSLQ